MSLNPALSQLINVALLQYGFGHSLQGFSHRIHRQDGAQPALGETPGDGIPQANAISAGREQS